MCDFNMNRAYNKRARQQIAKIASNFKDNTETFYTDKITQTLNKGLQEKYSTLVTFQCK